MQINSIRQIASPWWPGLTWLCEVGTVLCIWSLQPYLPCAGEQILPGPTKSFNDWPAGDATARGPWSSGQDVAPERWNTTLVHLSKLGFLHHLQKSLQVTATSTAHIQICNSNGASRSEKEFYLRAQHLGWTNCDSGLTCQHPHMPAH